MSLALVAVGWLLVGLPGVAHRWLRRGSPRATVTVATVALVAGVTVLEAGLLTWAAPTVLRSAGLTRLAVACQRMFDPLAVGGALVGWLAAAAAIASFGGAAYGVLRVRQVRSQAIVEHPIGEHSTVGGFELVMLPTDALVAYSVGTPTAQIVVSRGLIGMLDARAVDALLAHEAAHLRLGHDRYLLLGAVLEPALVWLPGVRSSVRAMRVALERCADEDATAGAPVLRAALARALVATACSEVSSGLAAFGQASGIVERITALQASPSEASSVAHVMAWGVIALLTLIGVSALAVWVADTRALLAMAAYCPG